MPPRRNPVAPAATRPARVAKTNGGNLFTAAIRGVGRQQAPNAPPRDYASPPPFDVDGLGAAISTLSQIQGLANRFRNLESIIEENQREFRSSLQDTFTQFMDRFDALEQCDVVPPHRHHPQLSYRPPYRRPPASHITSRSFHCP